MNTFKGKTIILGVPKTYDFDQVITDELKKIGFDVINISFYSNRFKYRNFLEKIECFIVKNLLWQRNYKTRIAYRAKAAEINSSLTSINKADYALIIRPDVYPISFIKSLRKKCTKMVAYQWDSLDRFPAVHDCIQLFDRFFAFDNEDVSKSFILPITNYYPDSIAPDLYDEHMQSDVFYSGNFLQERADATIEVIKSCQQLNKNVVYHLYKKKNSATVNSLKISASPLSFLQNLKYTYNSKVLLDFVIPAHKGLSFRFFEALGFDKKIITTNPNVKHYDFYNTNNILIWDNTTLTELENFLEKPYQPIALSIKRKYSFTNWIKYALAEGEFTPLNIPECE